MSTNLTLTARELELLKEVGKHLQTASVSQLPLPAPSLPLIHLSLNKTPLRLPNNFHSLTHSLTHKNRSTGPPSLKTSTTKLPKPLAINGIHFVTNFLEELRRAPTTPAPAAATATRRVVEVGRILLRRLFVRRSGNLVSIFSALLDDFVVVGGMIQVCDGQIELILK